MKEDLMSPRIDPRLRREMAKALKEVIRHFGTRMAVAKTFDVTWTAVNNWRWVPAHRVLEIERITGVPRHRLRPDLYPEKVTHER
jgi:DNA-binding transcriptional regulator YdaS (Cro superfamily)